MRKHFRLIGDVHGHNWHYENFVRKAEYSLQVGDMGFQYDHLLRLDPERHKVLAGNHDNYDAMTTGHWLGDFGVWEVPGFGPVFFVRGGYSIDWRHRTPKVTWWEDEQLSDARLAEAEELFVQTKPDFVVTHECPGSIIDQAFGPKMFDGQWLTPSRTAQALDRMWLRHRPARWVFGHHHKHWLAHIDGTLFRCLDILGVTDFEESKP